MHPNAARSLAIHLLKLIAWIGIFMSSAVYPCRADIIAPNVSQTALTATIPEGISLELDPTIAAKLEPEVGAFIQSRDLAAFRRTYAEIAKGKDSLPTVEVFLGKLLSAYNRIPEAISVLEKYTNENSEDPEAFVTFGTIALKTGRNMDAWLHLQHAQQLIDSDKLPSGRAKYVMPILTELQATVAERRRRWQEAEELFRKLHVLKPDFEYPLWRAGRAMVLAGQIREGFKLLSETHAKDSKLPPPSLTVAQTLFDLSDWYTKPDEAARLENWYKKAITEEPDNPIAWASYFKWLLLATRPEDVAKRFNEVPQSIRSNRDIQLMLSLAARYVGELDRAEKILSELNQANPDDIDVANQLALVFIESQDEDKRSRALELSERNFGLVQNSEPIIATAAWVQFRLGSQEVANKLLSQLAAAGSLSPQSTYYLAELMAKSNHVEESKQLLKIAAESPGIFPQREQVKRRLAN